LNLYLATMRRPRASAIISLTSRVVTVIWPSVGSQTPNASLARHSRTRSSVNYAPLIRFVELKMPQIGALETPEFYKNRYAAGV